MPRRLPRLTSDERGFTLIELVVVILVIGILAAIAIPMFTGKRQLAYDADAKSAVRNLVTYMDSCFVKDEDFTKCGTQTDVEATDVDWGTNPGQVSIVEVKKSSYVIMSISKAATGGVNHTFTIKRGSDGAVDRSCTGDGGCKAGTW